MLVLLQTLTLISRMSLYDVILTEVLRHCVCTACLWFYYCRSFVSLCVCDIGQAVSNYHVSILAVGFGDVILCN